jgi:hypothetical protein
MATVELLDREKEGGGVITHFAAFVIDQQVPVHSSPLAFSCALFTCHIICPSHVSVYPWHFWLHLLAQLSRPLAQVDLSTMIPKDVVNDFLSFLEDGAMKFMDLFYYDTTTYLREVVDTCMRADACQQLMPVLNNFGFFPALPFCPTPRCVCSCPSSGSLSTPYHGLLFSLRLQPPLQCVEAASPGILSRCVHISFLLSLTTILEIFGR